MMPIDLEAIEALAKAATPGPWRAKPHEFDDWGVIRSPDGLQVALAMDGIRYFGGYDDLLNSHRRANTDPTQHNMDFIAHAREDVPALIAEVRRLREENDALWETDALHRRSKECKDVALKEAQIWMNGCDVVAGGMIPDKSYVLVEITAALEADKEPS